MKNLNLKYLGMGLIILGAFLAILAMFVPALNFLLDQKFNWFVSLCLLFVLGGLFAHIMFNKYLPLSDDEEEDEPQQAKIQVKDDEATVVAK